MTNKQEISVEDIAKAIINVYKITQVDQVDMVCDSVQKLSRAAVDKSSGVGWIDICENVKSYVNRCYQKIKRNSIAIKNNVKKYVMMNEQKYCDNNVSVDSNQSGVEKIINDSENEVNTNDTDEDVNSDTDIGRFAGGYTNYSSSLSPVYNFNDNSNNISLNDFENEVDVNKLDKHVYGDTNISYASNDKFVLLDDNLQDQSGLNNVSLASTVSNYAITKIFILQKFSQNTNC